MMNTARQVRLRPTMLSDLDEVIAVEQDERNQPFITPWERIQHEGAVRFPDFRHFIIEVGTQPGPAGWLMPLVPFHFTLVQNIKRDPFEQNVGIDQKSAMSLGGALGAPATAFQYDWNILPIGQQLWMKELESYVTYPPLQSPATYNLEEVVAAVKSQLAQHNHASD